MIPIAYAQGKTGADKELLAGIEFESILTTVFFKFLSFVEAVIIVLAGLVISR